MDAIEIPLVIDLQWIRLARYCGLTGDTPAAVHARRRKETWQDDVHCRIAPDGNLWINVQAFNRWVTSPTEPPPPRQKKAPVNFIDMLADARKEQQHGST